MIKRIRKINKNCTIGFIYKNPQNKIEQLDNLITVSPIIGYDQRIFEIIVNGDQQGDKFGKSSILKRIID
jgi:hypothetical protein